MEVSSDAEIRRLFVDDTPLIDVRAPVEFARGAFPCAVNLPILNDDERRQVGIRYRQAGAGHATRLGHELVCGETRESRVRSWRDFAVKHSDAALYCFRGGQRSEIACQWLHERQVRVRRIAGGYKRMRNLLLKEFEEIAPLLLVSGQTGCGKTAFLRQFDRHLDLEGLARHRGSAFGGSLAPQPSQIDFENGVAIRLIKLDEAARPDKPAPVLLEDEGRLIGRIHLPPPLQSAMAKAPVILICAPLAARAAQIHDEYIIHQWPDYRRHHGEYALQKFSSYLLGAVDAIQRRLGGALHQEVREKMASALAGHARGDLSGHLPWIRQLLEVYYDPMYDHQLSGKRDRVIFEGSRDEAARWLAGRWPGQEKRLSDARLA